MLEQRGTDADPVAPLTSRGRATEGGRPWPRVARTGPCWAVAFTRPVCLPRRTGAPGGCRSSDRDHGMPSARRRAVGRGRACCDKSKTCCCRGGEPRTAGRRRQDRTAISPKTCCGGSTRARMDGRSGHHDECLGSSVACRFCEGLLLRTTDTRRCVAAALPEWSSRLSGRRSGLHDIGPAR